MTDPLTAISSILGSIKTAADIAQLLKNTDTSLEKAESKLKLADLVSNLADAKMQIASVQELLLEKDKRIKSLEETADVSSKLKWDPPYYWLIDGEKREGPYCQKCYDKDRLLIRLQDHRNGNWECKACKNFFVDNKHRTQTGGATSFYDSYDER